MIARRAGGRALATVAILAAVAVPGTAMGALGAGPPKQNVGGHARITFSQASRDVNVIGGQTFAFRFGAERGEGQAGDNCIVHERRNPRAFRPSPFGLPTSAPLWLYLNDRRRPASVVVRRWGSDPSSAPGLPSETLPVRRLVAFRFEGRPWSWAANVMLPPWEPSWLVARVGWRDADDCAAGDDFVAAGISFQALRAG